MPLPLPHYTDSELQASAMGEPPAGDTDAAAWDKRVWLTLVLHGLNSLYLGRGQNLSDEAAAWCKKGEPGAAQRKAISFLESYVEHFLREGTVPSKDRIGIGQNKFLHILLSQCLPLL